MTAALVGMRRPLASAAVSAAEVEYGFSDRWSALLGCRHLSIDRPAERRAWELELSGPVIGVRPL